MMTNRGCGRSATREIAHTHTAHQYHPRQLKRLLHARATARKANESHPHGNAPQHAAGSERRRPVEYSGHTRGKEHTHTHRSSARDGGVCEEKKRAASCRLSSSQAATAAVALSARKALGALTGRSSCAASGAAWRCSGWCCPCACGSTAGSDDFASASSPASSPLSSSCWPAS